MTVRSRQRDLFEIAVVYGMVLLVFWTPSPWQELLWGIAAACILAITWYSFDGLESMGLGASNFFRSSWSVIAALGVAGLAVLLAGRLHTLHTPSSLNSFLQSYFPYVIWAAIQQLVLQCFFLSRLRRLFSSEIAAAAAAAVLFAVAHFPSPILTAVTLIFGVVSCLLFLRYRNLYPLAIAHAILGISVAVTVPGPLDHNMLVGLSYLTYADHSNVTATIKTR